MTLIAGTRLGPYEIVSAVGAGGMGEVYRARDTRLDRTVAIKVLSEGLAADPHFRERFEREARTISQLNHPHICTLHDLGREGGVDYLVMEFVEGETLDQKIRHGSRLMADGSTEQKPTAISPQPTGGLAIDEALAIARQIAGALEAAHEKGIVHRDLKPANVKVTPDGSIKVLDFGLAKLGAGSADERHASGLSMSPTVFAGVTQAGVILGTAAYMSPEQARGLPVDKRADIWAFGCVLYEMLTAKPPFGGATATDIIAAIVRADPDFNALPASTPASIRRLLKRCLEKDRKKRLPDIGVVRLEIDDAVPPDIVADVAAAKRRSLVPWLIAASAVLALAAVSWYDRRAPAQTNWSGTQLGGPAVAMAPRISPDGQLLAFVAMVDGETQVAVMKPETGNWTILTHDRSRGGVGGICWSKDGARLYFDRWYGTPSGIFSVPVLGGEELLVVEDAASPEVLPDGSLLIERLNAERQYQLHRFWPESRRVQSFKVLMPLLNSPPFRATPGGDRVAFIGKPLDEPKTPNHLYAIDLTSERIVRLAPGVSFAIGDLDWFPMATAVDGQSAFVDVPADDLHRIVRVPMDGSRNLRTLLTLTSTAAYLDVGRDGALYVDQMDRPVEVMRVSPAGGTPEHIGVVPLKPGVQVLPLPNGRVLVNSRVGGRDRLLLMTPGREVAPFVETRDETAAPMTLVGQTHVAFLVGEKNSRTIALASLGDRRITGRLNGSKGAAFDSMVASPDGKTIYYAAAGSIWTISVDDGQPTKLRKGDSVTLDPYRQELMVRLTEKEGTRLVRVPIAGGPERAISLKGDWRLAPIFQQANAVGRDGRILAQVTSPASTFWPFGAIDPDTGRVEMIPIGYDADVGGGWTSDGKMVITAIALRSSVWRFRPEGAASK